jgi:hypothetical protein
VLKPALRRVWRDDTTLQIGLDPQRAIVLAGVDAAALRLLDALDGTREASDVLRLARDLGIDERRWCALLDVLSAAGLLDDASAESRLATLTNADRERLAPDIASLTLLREAPGGGLVALADRQRSAVRVHGVGRIGASLATLLAAAGVGRVDLRDANAVRPGDVAPAGAGSTDVGARRDYAAMAAVARVAPSAATAPVVRPDIVILTGTAAADPSVRDTLIRRGVPHLRAEIRETTGVVGPLVVPGESSCLRCHDLHRCDRDTAWPRIAAQLTAPLRNGPEACDVVLATAVATHAALQVLAFIDGEPAPATVDGTLEITLPDGRVRRRSWSAHPACGCHWAVGA